MDINNENEPGDTGYFQVEWDIRGAGWKID